MSNRALWDIRKRHVWLSTPLARKKMKRRARLRCGLEAALQRKAAKSGQAPAAEAEG
jgi:hypothetical protein